MIRPIRPGLSIILPVAGVVAGLGLFYLCAVSLESVATYAFHGTVTCDGKIMSRGDKCLVFEFNTGHAYSYGYQEALAKAQQTGREGLVFGGLAAYLAGVVAVMLAVLAPYGWLGRVARRIGLGTGVAAAGLLLWYVASLDESVGGSAVVVVGLGIVAILIGIAWTFRRSRPRWV